MKHLKACTLFALIALIVVLPYSVFGYSGHDFQFHVSSWIGVKSAWLSHTAPGWAEGANFGLGDPHFSFYPPMSSFLGGLILRIFPLRTGPGVYVWLVIFLSGCTMYVSSERFVGGYRNRVLAATLYMLNPYLLTTALIRFAAAELLVQALLPLMILAFYETLWRENHRAFYVLSALLGIAWLSNLPGAIVLLYTFAAVSVIVAYLQRSLVPFVHFILAEALAGALASFYLVPVWIEQKWINHSDLIHFEPRRGLLFMPQTSGPTTAVNEFGWLFGIAGIFVIALSATKRTQPLTDALRSLVLVATVSFIFLTPLAIPLWNHLPELRAVEFPFRFLPLLGVAVPLIFLSAGTRRAIKLPVYALYGILGILPIAGFLRVHTLAGRNQPDLNTLAAHWESTGYYGFPEYVPVDSHLANLIHAAALTVSPDCDAVVLDKQVGRRLLRTKSEGPCQVRLATLFYPWWNAKDESKRSVPVSRDSNGLLMLTIPPGPHTIDLSFHAQSKVRTWSAVISAGALLAELVALFFYTRLEQRVHLTKMKVQD